MNIIRDTLPVTGNEPIFIPSEALKFVDGQFIEQVIPGYQTLTVTGRESYEISSSVTRIGRFHTPTEYYQDTRTIKVEYQLEADTAAALMRKINALNQLLNVREQKIQFNDELDKFFIASSISVVTPPKGKLRYVSDFEIFCADPHKYSMDIKTVVATSGSDGQLMATISNQGSIEVPLTYRVKHNHENGFFGVASEYGAAQLGNAQEADHKVIKQSVWALRDDTQTELLNNWEANKGYLSSTKIAKTGSWKGYKIDYKEFVTFNSLGTGTGWHGPAAFERFKANSDGSFGSKSLTADLRLWFANSRVNQTGLMECFIANSDGSKRIGIGIHKSSNTKNVFRVKLYYSGIPNASHDREFTFDMNEATGGNKVSTYRTGIFQIKKIREKITFTFGGKAYTFVNNSLKDVVFENITRFSGQFANTPYCNKMDWDYFFIQCHDVDVETGIDVPNAYAKNSELIVQDGVKYFYNPNGSVTEEPIPIADVVGSDWFLVPPGETEVYFYYSDFSDPPPTVTIEYREGCI